MHFEHLLLSTMQDAQDVPAWQQALEAKVTAITGDDAAIALLGLGVDLDGFKKLFKDRTAEPSAGSSTPWTSWIPGAPG